MEIALQWLLVGHAEPQKDRHSLGYSLCYVLENLTEPIMGIPSLYLSLMETLEPKEDRTKDSGI